MIYRKNVKTNDSISLLGYGCMRFSRKDGQIDVDKAHKEVKFAVDNGVNYIDTAWIYEGNEIAVGEILSRDGLRSKVHLATKLPQWSVKEYKDFDKYLNESLLRLRTDTVDYYLIHAMGEMENWQRVVDLGIKDWIAKVKAEGKIKRIGFSYHGNYENYVKIMNDYDWEFVQLQYNVLDIQLQAGLKGMDFAYNKGVSVVVMEPLRGGQIANKLSANVRKLYDKLNSLDNTNRTVANLSLNFVYDHPAVLTVLSGMNDVKHVEDNLKSVDDFKPLTKKQKEIFTEVEKLALDEQAIRCTDCKYCQPCPSKIDIPSVFDSYNGVIADNGRTLAKQKFVEVIKRRKGFQITDCTQCRSCEGVCPQNLEIVKNLQMIHEFAKDDLTEHKENKE